MKKLILLILLIISLSLCGCSSLSKQRKIQPSLNTNNVIIDGSGNETVYLQGVPYNRDYTKIGNTDKVPGFYILDYLKSKTYSYSNLTVYSLRNNQMYYVIENNSSHGMTFIESKNSDGSLRFYDDTYDKNIDLNLVTIP